MASFRCYDNSDVIATLIMTNFHLNTTVVAIFPNASLWRHSLYSILVLTLKTNCIKPSSYASTAYVVVMRPSFLSDSFVKIWATCEIFLGKWFTAPPPPWQKISRTPTGADPGFFLGGGALVSCPTSTPINHIVFFCRIPVVLENRRSSQGGGRGAHPLHPPPRSAPGLCGLLICSYFKDRRVHLQRL